MEAIPSSSEINQHKQLIDKEVNEQTIAVSESRDTFKRRKQKIFVFSTKNDLKYLNKIKRWCKRQKCGPHYVSLSSINDRNLKSRNGRIIKSRLNSQLQEANFVVILVGNENTQHPWNIYYQMVNTVQKAVYFMRIPYTDKTSSPKNMEGITQIAYNPNAIDKKIREMIDKDTEAIISNIINPKPIPKSDESSEE